MQNELRSLKVFLCHAHADREAVQALYHRLIREGVDAWLDKENLIPGQDWEMEIGRAVEDADVVIVCLSKHFKKSGYRQREVRLALDTALQKPEGEIFIIPARLEECETLESLRKWHWVDLFEENGYQVLVRALRLQASRIGAVIHAHERLPGIYSYRDLDTRQAEASSIENTHTEVPTGLDPRGKLPPDSEKNSTSVSPVIEHPVPKRARFNTSIGVFLLALIGTLLAAVLAAPWIKNLVSPAPVPTASLTASPPISSPTPAEKNTPVPITLLPAIIDPRNVPMQLVPQGSFVMGIDNPNSDATPIRTPILDAYYIDRYEITNSQYQECVQEGACLPPVESGSGSRSQYYDAPQFKDYPVLHVNWEMANAYCQWRGARLPTEAEWEKAARGENGARFPWGNEGDGMDCNANYGGCDGGPGDTSAVGSYPKDQSVYGVYDLAGNAAEWVADWYQAPYPSTPENASNPQGPDGGEDRVERLAFYGVVVDDIADTRMFAAPNLNNSIIGFRCARSIPEKTVQPPGEGRIAFSSTKNNRRDLYMLDLPDRSITLVMEDIPSSLSTYQWSPDGRSLAYFSFSPAQAIYLVDARTLHSTLFQEVSPMFGFEWSPDSQELAVATYQAQNQSGAVFIFDLKTQAYRLLANMDVEVSGFTDPIEWAPDNSEIALSAMDQDGSDLNVYWISPSGAGLRNLTDDQNNPSSQNSVAHTLSWSPDSANLAVMTEDEIYLIDRLGEIHSIYSASREFDPSFNRLNWSPDSTRLIFDDTTGQIRVYDRTTEQLTSMTIRGHCASWSPDGSSILFVSSGINGNDLFLTNENGIETLTNNMQVDCASWQP